MKFRYRYVNFGTNFQRAKGVRTDGGALPERLHDNEIALDVGSAPWSVDGEVSGVVDNHFYPQPYPSASAGVLHLAEKIERHFAERAAGQDEIWLVAHRQPDFDAFCAMYLARGVISGAIEAGGWEKYGIDADGLQKRRGEIDWFRPEVGNLPPERRWPVLLAAYASCVDNCHPVDCPRHRGLHSVLYAALLRGRPYLDKESGAVQFFDEVRQRLSDPQQNLNPLFDSVLEGSATFAPELALLDRQREAYEQDLRRSRRTIVFLQQADRPFGEWYPRATASPLAVPGKNGPEIQAGQIAPAGGRRRQVDGIYLRDPQCLLFKEWVRNDLENSSMRQGFTFSAIAYSNERPQSNGNTNSYYFSLDPERADGCHLYNVWARLQLQELRALSDAPKSAGDGAAGTCRPGYEERAGKAYAAMFDDPWFDGSSYEATIVATPGRGTAIAAADAVASDLSDDPVTGIVQEELELSFFQNDLKVWDYSSSGEAGAGEPREQAVSVGEILRHRTPRATAGTWRFAQIDINDGVDLLSGSVAEQIGRLLWRVLDPDSRSTVPTDFVERHLIRRGQWLGVWSRHGIVMAVKPAAQRRANEVRQLCQDMAGVARNIEELSHRQSDAEKVLVDGDELMRRVVHIKHELLAPENNLVRRFFEAIRLDELLHSLRDINAAAAQRTHLQHQQKIAASLQKNVERITAVQRIIHTVEYLVVTYYGVVLWGHFFKDLDEGWYLLIPVALSIGLVAVANHTVERHWVEWAFVRQLFGKTPEHRHTSEKPKR